MVLKLTMPLKSLKAGLDKTKIATWAFKQIFIPWV